MGFGFGFGGFSVIFVDLGWKCLVKLVSSSVLGLLDALGDRFSSSSLNLRCSLISEER